MTRFFALSLSRTGTVVSYTMLAASALTLACLVWLTYSGLQLAKAEENRYASYLLADELRQSSDDLTRLARTYVVTGDESYEKQYLDILAIRNGEKTRPQNYHRIYWDLVAAGRPASPPSGVRKPLADLMQEAGFTTSEFALLSTAQKNSDGLVALEVEAMNAVKGLFADSAGAYTVKRSPDFERARLLMHAPDYHRFKADIMTPVNTFLTNMEARLAAQTDRIETQMQTASAIALFAALLLVVTAGLSTAVMQRRILRPLAALSQTMRDLAEGATVGTVPGLTRQDELGDMARSTDAFRQSAETALRLSREVEAAAKQREILSRQQAEAAKAAAEAAEREKAMLADSLATAELGRAFQENIALVVERVRSGDLTARAEVNPRLEISQRVGGTLNSMLDTIDETFGQIGITLENLASGDLMAAVPKGRGGRYSDILQVAEQTRQRLAALVDNVRNNADQVFDLAQSINSGADDLSRRTVHTAATLEESSAALTELSASVSSAAEGATHADQIVQQTRKAAEASKQVVNEAVAAMTQIEEQAEKIARIIDVIDGIAFQTNLLALNAGVEAARAGDSGRGFAVVASEVRALAQRSSEAAREINGLISTSGTHVAKGAQLVNQTGDALHGIYQSISGLSEHVAAIAVSAREQSNGINDISSAISMIERATTNNAEMVTRTTEVSSSLSQQASALRETLMRFRSAPEAVPQRRRA